MSLIQNLIPLIPEITLLLGVSVILLWGAYTSSNRLITCKTQCISFKSLTHLFLWLVLGINVAYLCADNTLYAWNQLFVSDPLANLLKAGCTVATLLAVCYSERYLIDRQMNQPEYYALALTALMGQYFMVSSHHLLMVYLGLELMSLSLYALVALRRDHKRSTEAAMKYFILGAMASGFLLYGMSMIYGATGSLDLATIFHRLHSGGALVNSPTAILGTVFMMAGLAFKFGAVPFHNWVPDVYDGSPTAITILIAAAPKLAALGIALRLMVEGMLPLAFDWQPMFLCLGVVSVIVGNLVAAVQTNFKRMLAYSAIAHIGFVMLALSVGVIDQDGLNLKTTQMVSAYGGAIFYMLTYGLTTLASFGIIMALSNSNSESDLISDLKGLAMRSPLLSLMLLIVMLSLSGIPPLVGFWAKLAVLESLLSAGYTNIAVMIVLASLVGVYCYLQVLRTVFFDKPEIVNNNNNNNTLSVSYALILNTGLLLGLGLFPDSLMNMATHVIELSFNHFK